MNFMEKTFATLKNVKTGNLSLKNPKNLKILSGLSPAEIAELRKVRRFWEKNTRSWMAKTLAALKKAKETLGTQKKLEALTGVSQSRIAELLNGRRYIGKATFINIVKLFPEIEITYSKDERPSPEAIQLAQKFDRLPPNKQEELLLSIQKFLN